MAGRHLEIGKGNGNMILATRTIPNESGKLLPFAATQMQVTAKKYSHPDYALSRVDHCDERYL